RRYVTVLICVGQGGLMTIGGENPQSIPGFGGFTGDLVMYHGAAIWWYRIQTVLILTTGTLLLMWLGEQITERGIGNGISLVITINILARLPHAGQQLLVMFRPPGGAPSQYHWFHGVALVALLVLFVAGGFFCVDGPG